jgi:hypothetical protein
MSTWVTPKTNWVSTDYFNISDYKRIVGNIEYLKDLVNKLFNSETKLNSIPAEKQYTSMIYADEINTIEANLEKINVYAFNIGSKKTYHENDYTPDFNEFNRIESAILKLYKTANSQSQLRRHLAFRLGSGKQLNVVRE